MKWELTLIEHTAGANWHAVSYTDTPAEALALKARYEQLPEVARVVEVASLVPADQEQKIRLLADIRQRLRHLPRRGQVIEHARPQCADLIERLDQPGRAIAAVGRLRSQCQGRTLDPAGRPA